MNYDSINGEEGLPPSIGSSVSVSILSMIEEEWT